MKNEKEFISFFKENKISNISKESYIKSHYIIYYNEIIKFNDLNFNGILLNFKQKLYNYINNIKVTPRCPVCGNAVNWNNSTKKYYIYCSNKCISNDKKIKNKIKATNLEKYGVECVF